MKCFWPPSFSVGFATPGVECVGKADLRLPARAKESESVFFQQDPQVIRVYIKLWEMLFYSFIPSQERFQFKH